MQVNDRTDAKLCSLTSVTSNWVTPKTVVTPNATIDRVLCKPYINSANAYPESRVVSPLSVAFSIWWYFLDGAQLNVG